jgi:hypothetical protein
MLWELIKLFEYIVKIVQYAGLGPVSTGTSTGTSKIRNQLPVVKVLVPVIINKIS